MNDASSNLPVGSVLNITGTDSMWLQQFHILSLIVRKPGFQAGPGSSAGATVPDRYAIKYIVLNFETIKQPPIVQLLYEP